MISITLIYLAIGACLAMYCDRHEMKQGVPYGKVPACMPLVPIRVMTCILMTIIGPAMYLIECFRGNRVS